MVTVSLWFDRRQWPELMLQIMLDHITWRVLAQHQFFVWCLALHCLTDENSSSLMEGILSYCTDSRDVGNMKAYSWYHLAWIYMLTCDHHAFKMYLYSTKLGGWLWYNSSVNLFKVRCKCFREGTREILLFFILHLLLILNQQTVPQLWQSWLFVIYNVPPNKPDFTVPSMCMLIRYSL